MTDGWKTVELGNVMRLDIDAVPVDSQPEFQLAGVYSFARGLFKRESLSNTQTTYKFFNRLHTDMFVISIPKGWEGALARVTENFDGMFLSPVFPTFRANPKELDVRYFEWYCRQPKIWDELRRKSRGIGARRESISAEKFLSLEIPLPPLDEQHRIIEHVEALATRISKAQSLRKEIWQESEFLLRSILADKAFGESTATPMRELVKLREPDVAVDPNETYHFAGVYSFGRGIFRGTRKKGNQFAYKKLSRLRANDFTYPKLMAWEGAYAIVSPECDGLVVSTEFPVFELNQEKILPGTMGIYFRNPAIWETLSGQSTGTNVRRRRLNPQTFLNYEFPLPPMKQQLVLRSVQARLASLREVQSAMGEELDALLPSVLDKAFKGEL